MRIRVLFLSLFFCVIVPSFSQQSKLFRSPMDIPILLSASFAELRPDHFHSGIDIKTQGTRGLKVFSVADGYVSRIKIQSAGYGKTLYITHTNGFVSVYAHLDDFASEIDQFVKRYQYKNEVHAFDVYPEPDSLKVKSGQFIAFSGNSGYSFGPHVHFEIREGKSGHPVNPLLLGFKVKDDVPPKISNIVIYPLSDTSFINKKNYKHIVKTEFKDGKHSLVDSKEIVVHGSVGFGLEALDYMNDTRNNYGLFSVELFVDGERIYYHLMKEFSFEKTRYINSLLDYEEYIRSKMKIQRLFIDPNNKLEIYQEVKNNGVFRFNDQKDHAIRCVIKDVYYNTSEIVFYLKSDASLDIDSLKVSEDYTLYMPYNKENVFEADGIKITLPAGSLYKDLKFQFNRLDSIKNTYSPAYAVHNEFTPVHSKYTLAIAPVNLPDRLRTKALIAGISSKGKLYSVGGAYENGVVKAKHNSFGVFTVAVDTTPPDIKPKNFGKESNLQNLSKIEFKVEDDLSGIRSYNGYIDNQWALFEYDYKYDVIEYFFDTKRIRKGKKHTLELIVVDRKGNVATYKGEFFY